MVAKYSDRRQPADHTMVEFRFGDAWRDQITFQMSMDKRFVYVISGGTLLVEPCVTNAIRIYPERNR